MSLQSVDHDATMIGGLRFHLLALVVAMSTAAGSVRASEQKFLEGLWLGVESGGVIELIAWAEPGRFGIWKMANGSLEDAPVIPRTYRILASLPAWKVINVVVATTDVFTETFDRIESVSLPFSAVHLSISAVEIGVPALENWDNVLRMRKSLKASEEKPLYVFLVLHNGTTSRYYPFRVDRPALKCLRRKPCHSSARSNATTKREWFHERKDQYELHCRGPMIDDRRAARRGLPIVRARDARRSEGLPAAAVSGHAVQRRQDAAEVPPRRDVSESRARPHERRGFLFRNRAGLGVDRRRAVAAGYLAAATGSRAHRRQPAAVRRDRESAALQEARRAARRSTDPRAARIREGSSGRGVSAASAVHGFPRRGRRRSPPRRISTSNCATRCRRSRRWCSFSTSRWSRRSSPTAARIFFDE